MIPENLQSAVWIAIGILHLIALADLWFSRLTPMARVLWTLTLVFLPGVGVAAWLLTRASAHQPLST